MTSIDRQPRRGRRAARILVNLAIAGSFAFLVAACNGAGGLASYQGDSSYGCRASATKTVCPR